MDKGAIAIVMSMISHCLNSEFEALFLPLSLSLSKTVTLEVILPSNVKQSERMEVHLLNAMFSLISYIPILECKNNVQKH